MTITKKVGSLLLLLTVGSLVGIVTFAIFLQKTSVDFLFFLAASHEERLLQQLYVNTVMIRDGHEDVRPVQRDLIQQFDALLNALENGGPNPSRLTPMQLTLNWFCAASYRLIRQKSTGSSSSSARTTAWKMLRRSWRSPMARVMRDSSARRCN